MATVITNLLSAIPWIGQDIVESTNLVAITVTNIMMLPVLTPIGNVSPHALKKFSKKLDEREYLNIPYSFIAFLVGVIDGNGYIMVNKTKKGFITIKLIISVSLDDKSTLEYIQSGLKLGKLIIYKDNKNPTAKLIINRTDLQKIFFPLLLYHNIFFLTETRKKQFNLAIDVMKFDKKVYENIPTKTPELFKLPHNSQQSLSLKFFRDWIVGFTVAEGSFLVKKNNDGCFQIKQRLHIVLFEAFKLIFESNHKTTSEKNLYNQFAVSSLKDIERVINFFSFSGYHPLIGLKNIKYQKWIENLKNNVRYNMIKFPD